MATRPHGAFYDHVTAVLRGGQPMRVTPESVRETMRVLSLIRKGTKFAGKVSRVAGVSPMPA